jgi:two-component system cell cycle response regulator
VKRQVHLPLEELEQRERIIVVAAPETVVETLRQRYPLYEVVERPTYLAGIAELGQGPAAAVLVQIPPFQRRASSVIAGFRAALRNGGRLVMCCEPAAEPTAREALRAGADDYLIHPPTGEELDAGLGLTPADGERPVEGAGVSVSADEVRGLIDVMSTMRSGPRDLAADAAEFIQHALRASGARVEFASHRATAGELPEEPVLVEPIAIDGKVRGHVFVGPRPKLPYGRQDVERLSLYAGVIARLFEAGEDRRKWQRMALTDDLSGLRNRRYLLQALAHLLRRAEAERFRLTLLILDIDDFKRYNDQFGHAVGDELIREIARLLTGCCRRHDLVTRLGGDEFAVVFWDAEEPREAGSQHPSDVLAVLRRLRDELRTREWQTLGPEARGRLTISGGLAGFPWDARTPDELLRKADQELLNAKRLGKDRIHIVGGESLPPDESKAE